MKENNNYIVDVGSFYISENEYQKLNSMTTSEQRLWLSEQVLNGNCTIDQINK